MKEPKDLTKRELLAAILLSGNFDPRVDPDAYPEWIDGALKNADELIRKANAN